MPPAVAAAAIGGGASIVSGVIGSKSANKQRQSIDEANKQAMALAAEQEAYTRDLAAKKLAMDNAQTQYGNKATAASKDLSSRNMANIINSYNERMGFSPYETSNLSALADQYDPAKYGGTPYTGSPAGVLKSNQYGTPYSSGGGSSLGAILAGAGIGVGGSLLANYLGKKQPYNQVTAGTR
jgi:hypothetical protein